MITVLGHKGFIGSEIVRQLIQRGTEVYLPERDEDLSDKDLGKVIYCIGLTADAKKKPFETIDAHINKLSQIIRYSKFEDITYASSTRVYVHNQGKVSENSLINVDVSDPFELFNLTKLTAESLLVNTTDHFKIVRYSNVYGNDLESENFLTSVIKEAIIKGSVVLHTTPDSGKDYISVYDAANLTIQISLSGKKRIYNIAAGKNIINQAITDQISKTLNCKVVYSETAKHILFPEIDNTSIKEEFGFKPSTILMEDIDLLINTFRKELSN